MAFLLSNQNQGTRNDTPRGMRLSRPFSFIRTLTVGFGITPNLLTLLPSGFQGNKELAGLGCLPLTAGGDVRPALRTAAARHEQPDGTMPKRQDASKHLPIGNPHVPHDARARLETRGTRLFASSGQDIIAGFGRGN